MARIAYGDLVLGLGTLICLIDGVNIAAIHGVFWCDIYFFIPKFKILKFIAFRGRVESCHYIIQEKKLKNLLQGVILLKLKN